MMICKGKTIEGKPCKNHSISGFLHCREHLDKQEKQAWNTQKLLGKTDLILILQKSLNKVENAQGLDILEQTRAIVSLTKIILDLGGNVVKEKNTFQDRVKEWEAENK